MRAILAFRLPQESEEFRIACDGGKWMSVCHEFAGWIRSRSKYGEQSMTADEARMEFYRIMQERGVSFD